MAKVVVGLSGGVDSSVAAYLLQQQGHEVIGMYMRNWHDDSVTLNNECPWIDDSNDALAVAEYLGIPFHTIDLSIPYKERIVDYMFSEYEKGRTPNPDVLCNREIKFDVFLNAAISLQADYVATGHYCRKITDEDGYVHLLSGKDSNKDQSYFLCQMNTEQLKKSLFPIGDLLKSEVRVLAAKIGLPTAAKKDSQGLCFVGKISLPDFLQQQLKPKIGNVILISDQQEALHIPNYQYDKINDENFLSNLSSKIDFSALQGTIIGQHNGAHYYTIGQRKGLKIGGFAHPLFIVGIDTVSNTIYVGEGEQHQALLRPALFIPQKDIHHLQPLQYRVYNARIRYRQPLTPAALYPTESGVYVVFEKLQKGITPGQFVAWYSNDDELMGSGVID